MIGSIRKHSNWLWAIIVTAVIASFVIWSDAGGGRNSFDFGGSDFGKLYGRPITRDQLLKARTAVSVDDALRGGRARGASADNERQVAELMVLQAKVKEMGIQVSDDAVGKYLRENFKDANTGTFNYDVFIQNLLQRTRIDESTFLEHIRQQVAIQHMVETVGAASRLVTPREVESDYRRDNERWVTKAALFSVSNRVASITAKPEELTKFYSNRIAYYRIPERSVLVYVRFDATNYIAEAESMISKEAGFTNRLEEFYKQRGAEMFRDENDKVLSKEAALRKIRDEASSQGALGLARQAAVRFNDELGALTNVTASSFAMTASKLKVPLRSTTPFRVGERIMGLETVQSLPQRVAGLNAETPYTEPLDGEGFVVIPMLQTKLPPEIPSFETVRERVLQDYKMDRARAATREAGEKFQATAAAGLASGKRFDDITSSEKVPVISVPEFTTAAQNVAGLDSRLNLYLVRNAATSAKSNGVSRYTESSDGGFVLYLEKKEPVSDEAVKLALPTALAEARQQRRMAVFQSWFASEFQKSGALASKPTTLSGVPPAQ
ncbi:MAG: SurA N-terminal domain-containing protein [Verrucomicrobia bacterium]|nr:SurA N-terminal domain-containing protein [Verrucomicrobiota bacterium]